LSADIDPRASSAFSSAADEYERGRPPWPPEAIELVARRFELGPESDVLDLAAGTGKLSRVLPGRVTAVEPLDAMRAAIPPGIEAIAGTAEDIPLADVSMDAVFVADALHWFDRERAIPEIARVLRPGGGFAILWNRREWNGEVNPWLDEFGKLVQPHIEAAGGFALTNVDWTGEIEATGLFDKLAEDRVEHLQRVTPDEFLALIGSWSHIANLPGEERATFLDQVRALIGDQPEIELRYAAQMFTTRRLSV
jgi:SAM-dependent methyltransferase